MKPTVINQHFSNGTKIIVNYLVYYIMYVRHLTFNRKNINVLTVTNIFIKKKQTVLFSSLTESALHSDQDKTCRRKAHALRPPFWLSPSLVCDPTP